MLQKNKLLLAKFEKSGVTFDMEAGKKKLSKSELSGHVEQLGQMKALWIPPTVFNHQKRFPLKKKCDEENFSAFQFTCINI